ncbi:MAG TPA: vitamin K epoxide reductase family protein [Chthoniobacterales bacterium]|nr:vitamin K epoxide reductase family protein [Chthoniobacterales bacterium]
MNEPNSARTTTPRGRLRSRLYAVAAMVALLGLADGIYLTIEHITGRTAECIASSGCQDVLSSKYAAIGHLPLAAVGAFAYFTVFSAALLAAFGYRKCGPFFAFVVTIMFGMTLWLLYLQAFVLHAFCDYCLFSAGVTAVLTAMAVATTMLRDRS